MSATSFNRMRRLNALKETLDAKGFDYSAFPYDEAALREAVEGLKGGIIPDGKMAILGDNGQPEKIITLNNDDEKVIEAALRAEAKKLGIKSYHLKSVETLEREIAEMEKGEG